MLKLYGMKKKIIYLSLIILTLVGVIAFTLLSVDATTDFKDASSFDAFKLIKMIGFIALDIAMFIFNFFFFIKYFKNVKGDDHGKNS